MKCLFFCNEIIQIGIICLRGNKSDPGIIMRWWQWWQVDWANNSLAGPRSMVAVVVYRLGNSLAWLGP